MSFIGQMVTDRTAADVESVRALARRISAGTATAADITRWNAAASKGAYNYTDLNRVTEAMEALRDVFIEYDYRPVYADVLIPHRDGTTSTRWRADDETMTAQRLEQYRQNLAGLRNALPIADDHTSVPETMSGLTWAAANDIEQLLEELDAVLTRMEDTIFRCNELLCGEG